MAKTYDNSGSLSRNERKEQPNHADYRGKATIDGVEYWISAWIKTGENGKWLSLSFKPKEEAPTTRRAKYEPGDAPDSDLPFK